MDSTHVEPSLLEHQPQTDATSEMPAYYVYGDFDQASHLREAWNDLAARTGGLLCSYEWCHAWWTYFSRWRRLEIHTLHDGHKLVAVLPLFRETIRPLGVRLRTVRALGCDYASEAVSLAIEPPYAEQFIHMVLEHVSRTGAWDILQIAPLRSYCTVVEQLAEACTRDQHVRSVIFGRQDNWLTLFHLPDTYEEFLGSLPGKTRTEMHRRQRQLDERGVLVEAVFTPEQLERAMDAMVQLHQERWTSKGQPGRFGMIGAAQEFHRSLARRMLSSGQLLVLVLKVDDQVLSVLYGYRFGPRVHALFGSHCYDQQWQRYGIGRIMYSHLIRHAVAQGANEVDDGRGVFEHKLSLGGQLYGEQSLVAVHKGWSSRLRFWAAMRASYLIHVLYSRLWVDAIAPRIGIIPKGRHFHVRYGVLAQLFRRLHFPLFGGPKVLYTRCLEPKPQ